MQSFRQKFYGKFNLRDKKVARFPDCVESLFSVFSRIAHNIL